MHSDGRLALIAQRAASALAPFVASAPRRPVFIIGCARSGTSILKRKLALHPDVAGVPSEANHLWHPKAYPWRDSDLSKPPLWADPARFTELSLADWTPVHARRIQSEFGLYQSLLRKPVFLNKSAMVAFMLPTLVELFPSARFIHIHRDARAVALSYARKEYGKMRARPEPYRARGHFRELDALLERMAALWLEHVREIERARRALALDARGAFFQLSYEELCAAPAAVQRRIHAFLGLDPERAPSEATSGLSDRNDKSRSALSAAQLAEISAIAKDGLVALGYPLEALAVPRP